MKHEIPRYASFLTCPYFLTEDHFMTASVCGWKKSTLKYIFNVFSLPEVL